MATYHIDPSAAANGTGTAANPFNNWASVPLGAGHVYRQRRGTTWSGAFPSLTNGTAGAKTTIGAYARADGTDDPALPAPVIDIGDRMFPGTLGSPKSFIRWERILLRSYRTVVAGDTPMMWVGDDVEFEQVELDTNLTALYAENRHRLKIRGLRITACREASATAAMNAIVISGTVASTGIDIEDLDVLVGDGGPSNCHAVKIGGSTTMTDLRLAGIRVRTVSGAPTTHINKAGVFVSNAEGAHIRGEAGTSAATIDISGIDVENLVDGLFLSSVRNAWVHDLQVSRNNSFGIHGTGTPANPLSGCVFEWFTANENGRNVSPWYGRGIELSGGGAQHACTSNVIRFFEASRNRNWGGPGDNGTEGVGVGLDDATSFTLVYSGTMVGNEGQAVQTYGGATPPADTGGNVVVGCFMFNNGVAALWSRRGGGTVRTGGACNVSLSGTRGARTILAYNLIVGGFGGIRMAADCSNVARYGNVFIAQESYAHATPNLTGIEREIYSPGIPRNIGTLALNGSNSPAPTLLSSGTATDQTIDPMLDPERWMPLAGSPLLARAVPWASSPYRVTNA